MALQQVAAVLAVDTRAGDTAYRFGGEEFIVLLADEFLPGAVIAVDRFRQTIEALSVPHAGNNPPGVLTISAGVATYEPGSALSSAAILELADQALYRAKNNGRNQVAIARTADLAATK